MKKISLKSASLECTDENILFIRLKNDAEIDLDDSKEMQRTSISMMQNKKFVALIDARAKVEVSKESREWGSTKEAQINMVAQAILIDSLANKLVGNFIIRFHKPNAKTKLFSEEKAALEWLREQKIKFGIK